MSQAWDRKIQRIGVARGRGLKSKDEGEGQGEAGPGRGGGWWCRRKGIRQIRGSAQEGGGGEES